eukprot:819706-Prymnesium_polylepis.1
MVPAECRSSSAATNSAVASSSCSSSSKCIDHSDLFSRSRATSCSTRRARSSTRSSAYCCCTLPGLAPPPSMSRLRSFCLTESAADVAVHIVCSSDA